MIEDNSPRSFISVVTDLFPHLFVTEDTQTKQEIILDLSVKNPRVFSIIVDAVSLRQHLESGKTVI